MPKGCSCKRNLQQHVDHAPIQRGGGAGFLSNTGPDRLKITKLISQNSMLGHHRPASETPFKWRFTGGPMMARFSNTVKASKPRLARQLCLGCRSDRVIHNQGT